MNKIMEYELKFNLKNAIPSGSVIKIQFPPTFKIIDKSFLYSRYYIKYGLEDISEDSPVGIQEVITAVFNYLLITNFKPLVICDEISLIIRARNPNAFGPTTPLKITSYREYA